jgi:arylsulfatase A-like enzyme
MTKVIDTGFDKLISLSIVICLLLINDMHAQQQNVLLIISDDLNTRIGPYMDLENHTPNLDRLAGAGVRFSRAYCQYPLCGPSRASLMSGLYPETTGVLRNQSKTGSYRATNSSLVDHPSMAGFFREQGYFTARVSKIFHMGVPGGIERGEPGDDDPDSWDFALNVMGPETLSPGTLELLSPKNPHYGSSFTRMIIEDQYAETQADYLATSQAIAILESRAAKIAPNATNKIKLKPDAPFFLAVGLVRPHVPFVAPASCFDHYPDESSKIPEFIIDDNVPAEALKRQNHRTSKMNEAQKQKVISGYMASVRFMDEQVGRLLKTLDRLNLRDQTIVVFISDHGYNLGEHDCWAKSSLWEGTLRVPMIISVPGKNEVKGTSNSTIVELIDLYPTLAELCELADSQPGILQGKSLADQVRQHQPESEGQVAYSISYGGQAGTIKTERWRYTRWSEEAVSGKEELYNHVNDPEEHYNLAQDPSYQTVLEEMRAQYQSKRNRAKK